MKFKRRRLIPKRFPSGHYLLWCDRKTRQVIVMGGSLHGHVLRNISAEGFYSRRWKYVGTVEGKRVKAIGHCNKTLAELLAPGLRKVYRQTLRQIPADFKKWANVERAA